MKFCPWYALGERERHLPSGAGVFQIRVARGLIEYPRGKSAMLYYGWGDELRAVVDAFAAKHPGRDWLCRHNEGGLSGLDSRERTLGLAGSCQQLLERFAQRFGVAPALLVPAESAVGRALWAQLDDR